MKKFKLIPLLLAAVMIFTACGQAASTETETTTPEAAKTEADTSEASEETTAAQESEAAEESAPAEEELEYVKLKFVNYGSAPESGNYEEVWKKINEMLLEDINAEIEIEWIGPDSTNKYNMKYASQEVFDFAYDASWNNYGNNAKANAFREVTMEEIQKYMPLVYEQQEEIAWEQAKVNGKIYMIPQCRQAFPTPVVLIRGDLREKYGLDPLETMEDFYEYSKMVLENETNMTITKPLGTFWRATNLRSVNNYAEVISTPHETIVYSLDDAENGVYECFSWVFTDEFVEYVQKNKECYEAGYWAADAISDATTEQAMFENGLAAVFIHNVETVESVGRLVNQAHPEWKVEMHYLFGDGKTAYNPFLGNGTVINRLAENPERAMMAINLLLGDPEYNNLVIHGIEGVNYEINEEGKKVALEADEANTYIPGCNWNWNNNVIGLEVANRYEGFDKVMDTLKATAVVAPIQSFTFDSTGLETEIANCKALIAEYKALEFGMVDDAEAAVNEYRDALTNAGIQKILDELNAQLQEQFAK